MSGPMYEIRCQDHSLNEAAQLLEGGKNVLLKRESCLFLANWLKELARSRTAVYQCQVALESINP